MNGGGEKARDGKEHFSVPRHCRQSEAFAGPSATIVRNAAGQKKHEFWLLGGEKQSIDFGKAIVEWGQGANGSNGPMRSLLQLQGENHKARKFPWRMGALGPGSRDTMNGRGGGTGEAEGRQGRGNGRGREAKARTRAWATQSLTGHALVTISRAHLPRQTLAESDRERPKKLDAKKTNATGVASGVRV